MASRGVHKSSFFPTRNWPVQDQVDCFSTHNQPVTVTNSSIRVVRWRSLVLGELDIHWNLVKWGEISLDPARFLQNFDKKSPIRLDSVFIVPEIDKFKWKVVRIWKRWPNFMAFGGSGFTGFRGRDSKPDPPASGFWSQDLSPTAKAIESGGSRLGSGRCRRLRVDLDSPSGKYHLFPILWVRDPS